MPGAAQRTKDVADLLGRFPHSAAVFLPGGTPLEPGNVLRQPDLARSLRKIAEGGRDVFYKGELAQAIGEYLQSNGGALTAEDFADHETTVQPPLATTYRGHTVYQTGLPTQGFLLLETLNMLSGDQIQVADEASVHVMAEALKRSFADRLAYAGDPARVPERVSALLAPDWAAARRATMCRWRLTTFLGSEPRPRGRSRRSA